ncbi:MAG: 3'(2'),5'-bisphosphate nucleotidase CysQ [Acidimicrobiales bacterium]|nr:3'(2'),5'-bisphosphate nucleotidase CysQ [Acidimicrobiia bacterium]NNC80916.1 3'(2'),5'-bisphosphate nucleotidase CysQ [Acidimicrobiales bacterium]
MTTDDEVAADLAAFVGEELVALQTRAKSSRQLGWWLEDEADSLAHDLLVKGFAEHRPEDAVLSEEGTDTSARLSSARAWIVDPLDGSNGFGSGGDDWAVHVALTVDGEATAAAVSVPGLGEVFSTARPQPATVTSSPLVVVTGRSRSWIDGPPVAMALGATLETCGSAGVKAMLVVLGEADVYVHASPLYEWDVCAPVAVAESAGLVACAPDGSRLQFNNRRPVVPGIVVTRPELVDRVVSALNVTT